MSLRAEPVAPGDLPEIASIHLAAFPESAISRVGAEAVRRYYSWQLESAPDLVFLAAWREDRIVGYVCGGVLSGALTGFLRRNWPYLAMGAIMRPHLLVSRTFTRRARAAARLLLRRALRRSRAAEQPSIRTTQWGILSIAARPDAERTGVGSFLLDQIERLAKERRVRELHLTVHPANAKAIEFYGNLGWQKVGGPPWLGEMRRLLLPSEDED